MARTSLTPVTAPGGYAGAGAACGFVDADIANGNRVYSTGKELVLARNTGAAPVNVTITSASDPFNRSGDIVEAVAAGVTKVFGPFPQTGWRQADSYLYLSAPSTDIEFVVVVLP